MRYPDNWFPSGVVYGNAFEIRNYEPQNPMVRPEQDRASLLMVDMMMETPEQATSFLNTLLAKGSNAEREVDAFTIDGRRAIRVKERLKAQELGPGAIRRGPLLAAPAFSSVLHLSTYFANGRCLVRLWAKVPVGANPAVSKEILRIQNSVMFTKKEDGR